MAKNFLMVTGTEWPCKGMGNWHYAACFVCDETARLQKELIRTCPEINIKIFEIPDEEYHEIQNEIRHSLGFQLRANALFHGIQFKGIKQDETQ